ncbi:hypothetical protein [Gracilibacillus sp. JCM 18860]|uniref:hypothetical protein n=1 Tax=Gracilibacillus sp. JCM 18860 TaxID=1306159 RepID=UPI00326080B7
MVRVSLSKDVVIESHTSCKEVLAAPSHKANIDEPSMKQMLAINLNEKYLDLLIMISQLSSFLSSQS